VENDGKSAQLTPLPHDPQYGETATLPFCYNSQINNLHYASNFFNFLTDCWGKDPDFKEKVLALQEMIASSLFGVATDYQRAFLLYGVASSGKTTLLNIVRQLFSPSSIAVIPPERWSDRFSPRFLANKRVNICGELSDKQKIDGKSFKEIVDGTEIVAEIKGGDMFNLKPIASQWFGSNHLPKTNDVSEGFNRRFLILSFNHVISDFQKVIKIDNYTVKAPEK
jgi:phage/plasmid-associated DNA primase